MQPPSEVKANDIER